MLQTTCKRCREVKPTIDQLCRDCYIDTTINYSADFKAYVFNRFALDSIARTSAVSRIFERPDTTGQSLDAFGNINRFGF